MRRLNYLGVRCQKIIKESFVEARAVSTDRVDHQDTSQDSQGS
jgi:hypothetical protein